jgi:hypothetical protein
LNSLVDTTLTFEFVLHSAPTQEPSFIQEKQEQAWKSQSFQV